MADSTPIVEIGPNDRIIFSIVPVEDNQTEIADKAFTPEYYPDRFNRVLEKELRKNGQQCKGQDVSIKNFKNAKVHATGICLSEQVPILEYIHAHEDGVNLYTPISPDGGLQAYVKKIEMGEIHGWNPQEDQWMINYTIDFISTGYDEYGGDAENDVVTTLLNSPSRELVTESNGPVAGRDLDEF